MSTTLKYYNSISNILVESGSNMMEYHHHRIQFIMANYYVKRKYQIDWRILQLCLRFKALYNIR